ncbi:MAG TPA: hypothetical protein VGR86_08155 [Steroidobacteraceae bacterium]|nr:hypothetical protein [Steroidobacteraceae bacterium]
MNGSGNKKRVEEKPVGPEANRRRIGLVVHDDRGQASVEWHDAPADFERPVLEILGNPELTLKNDDVSYDPYARHAASLPKTNPGNTTRTDLRKLSEWIKMKRAMEERKLHDDDDDDES